MDIGPPCRVTHRHTRDLRNTQVPSVLRWSKRDLGNVAEILARQALRKLVPFAGSQLNASSEALGGNPG